MSNELKEVVNHKLLEWDKTNIQVDITEGGGEDFHEVTFRFSKKKDDNEK